MSEILRNIHIQNAIDLLRDGLGDWSGVDEVYQPDAPHTAMKLALNELEEIAEKDEA